MKPRILVIGSSNTDMVIQLDQLPEPGETRLGGAFSMVAGGKGANQAVAAARAGATVTFLARIGHDLFGDQAMTAFRADGLHVEHVVRDRDSPSGVALILVDKNGQNSIAVAPGANGQLTAEDVTGAQGAFRGASVLLVQLETPLNAVQAAVERARACGLRVVLNPAPARPLPDHLLSQVDVLTPNDGEAALLAGVEVDSTGAAARAAETLLARGVRNVIITLGARGAFVAGPGVRCLIPAFNVTPVDSTGAGDVFNGALAVALAEGRTLVDAAQFASAAAAISVTRPGAQPSIPTRREIEQQLAEGEQQSQESMAVASEAWSASHA